MYYLTKIKNSNCPFPAHRAKQGAKLNNLTSLSITPVLKFLTPLVAVLCMAGMGYGQTIFNNPIDCQDDAEFNDQVFIPPQSAPSGYQNFLYINNSGEVLRSPRFSQNGSGLRWEQTPGGTGFTMGYNSGTLWTFQQGFTSNIDFRIAGTPIMTMSRLTGQPFVGIGTTGPIGFNASQQSDPTSGTGWTEVWVQQPTHYLVYPVAI